MISKDEIQDQCLEVVLPLRRCGAALSMGVGKTLIGLRHMDENYNDYSKFLVVAPKISVLNEWTDQAIKHDLPHLVPHITKTTYLSLPKQSLDYDVVYLDECHSLTPAHLVWLSEFKGKILGLTGTPPKNKTSPKAILVSQFCPIVFNYKTDKAIKDKILNDYSIIVHLLKMDVAQTMKVENNGKVWFTSEAATYKYWSGRLDNANPGKDRQIMAVMRMKALMTFPSKERLAKEILNEAEDKIILFANTQEQADSFGILSYHSNNPKSEENLNLFKAGKIKKLSCVLQLSEGVNIPNLKEGIIMHSYGNERKSQQRIGRLLRLNPEEESLIHILCYKDTVDEFWVKAAIEGLDQSKVTWQDEY